MHKQLCLYKMYRHSVFFLFLQDTDIYKDYKIFLSTIFKLFGLDATTAEKEVQRIVDMEKGFAEVGFFFQIMYKVSNFCHNWFS